MHSSVVSLLLMQIYVIEAAETSIMSCVKLDALGFFFSKTSILPPSFLVTVKPPDIVLYLLAKTLDCDS